MLHSILSQQLHRTGANRPVAAAARDTAQTSAVTSFYFGYWFSHWRA